MTYLEIVNNILKRLRERTVSSVNENSYSALIGILVNDAKQEVEDSWDWSGIRTTLTAITSPNAFSYVLTGSGNRLRVLDVVNDTADVMMEYRDANWMTRQFLLTDQTETSTPYYYSYNGLDSAGDTIVDIYPIPDGVYEIRFNIVLRTPNLVNDSDQLYIPTQAVLLRAYAKAVEERGEDGGASATNAYAVAERALSDAIALDAAKHPEELIWTAV